MVWYHRAASEWGKERVKTEVEWVGRKRLKEKKPLGNPKPVARQRSRGCREKEGRKKSIFGLGVENQGVRGKTYNRANARKPNETRKTRDQENKLRPHERGGVIPDNAASDTMKQEESRKPWTTNTTTEGKKNGYNPKSISSQ